MIKLSIVMMVKNESKYLEACLKGIQQIRDTINSELIIVDTGSNDNTVEISRRFTEKVYFHKWNNDFSEIRNITIDYAKGEWILFIDGDEIIKDATDIINFFEFDAQTKYNTVCISIKSFVSSSDEQIYSTLIAPRIFKNDGEVHFKGKIHEQLMFKLPVLLLNTEAMHYGYLNDDDELMEKKFQRTSKMLLDILKIEPENIYYNYQLSITYAMHKDYNRSLEQIEKTYKIAKENSKGMAGYIYIYSHLAKMNVLNGEYAQSEKICMEALEYDKKYIDLYFYLAKSQYLMNRNKAAIDSYEVYLKKISNYSISNISRNISITHETLSAYEEAYLDLGNIYYNQYQYDVCLNYAKKIKSNTYIEGAIIKIVDCYIKLKKYEELQDYYEREVCIEHSNFENLFILQLEKRLVNLNEKEKENIHCIFSKVNTEYSLLNKIRLEKGKIEKQVRTDSYKLDFNVLPDYYADILYYFMLNMISINDILEKTSDFKIKYLFEYLIGTHKELGNIVYDYLFEFEKGKEKNFNIRNEKILAYYALYSKTLDKVQYREVFFMYLKVGMQYLELVYNEDTIKKENTCFMKNEEDLFLMYIKMANDRAAIKIEYIKYLRKALNTNNNMSRGVDILREDATKLIGIEDYTFKLYKEKIKKNISELINANNVENAKLLIEEYSNIVYDDVEIDSMKAVIAILENRLEEAEDILKSAMKKFGDSFDLLYNLAYVYEQMNNKQKALKFYKKAVEITMNQQLIEDINNIIKKIKNASLI